MAVPSSPEGGTSELSGSPFYRLATACRETRPGYWIARATVCRLDTGEEVKGIQHSGESQAEALEAIKASLPALIASLDRTPNEWGRVQLRNLLRAYRNYNDALTAILVRSQRALASGTLDSTLMHSEFWEAREVAVDGSMELARQLAALPEQDRIDLMTSPDAAYLDPMAPFNLDDLDARRALFRFVLNPSAAVIDAHQRHLARWPDVD